MGTAVAAFRTTDTGLAYADYTLTARLKSDGSVITLTNGWTWVEHDLGVYVIDAVDVTAPATFYVRDTATGAIWCTGEFDGVVLANAAHGGANTTIVVLDNRGGFEGGTRSVATESNSAMVETKIEGVLKTFAASRALGLDGADAFTLAHSSAIPVGNSITLYAVEAAVGSDGFPRLGDPDYGSSDFSELGTLDSTGWTEAAHGGSIWASAIFAQFTIGFGADPIPAGTLTLTITDECGTFSGDWEIEEMSRVNTDDTKYRWFAPGGEWLGPSLNGGNSQNTVRSAPASSGGGGVY